MKLRVIKPAFVLIAGVSAMTPAVADLPPQSGASPKAAVAQLIADAQKAIKAGKLPLAVIDLKNASSADPRNGQVRAQLGALLVRTGDYYGAEQELRQARKDGGPDQLILPSLLQAMVARNEYKALLDEFPEPANPSTTAPDILKARALALLNLGQAGDASDAMDKSLKLRRDVPGLLLRARIAQKASAPTLALQFVNDAIAMAPNDIDASLFKITLLLDSNDMSGALTFADQVAAKFPSSLPAKFARIEVLMRMKEDDKAKAAVDAILAEHPGMPLGLYDRALLLARSGDVKGAWRIAQSLSPEFLVAQPQIALMASQMANAAGRSETGASILGSAISHFPNNPDLRLALAAMRFQEKDVNGAQNAIAPLKDSLDPSTAQALVRLYISSNKPDLALDLLEKLAQSGKGTDATTLELAELEARMGQSDQALKDLSKAVDQKPSDVLLANQLINNLMARKRFDDAMQVADKLGKDPAQEVTSLVLRGQVFLAQNKLDDALASYARAIKVDPKNQVALFGHAIILEQMQRFDDASKDLKVILNINPRHTAAYLKLAEIAARQNQDAQVRTILGEAIKQMPADPAPRVTLARYLLSRNDQPEALTAVNALLKLQPNNTEGLELLGGIQLATGKKSDAVATFKRLVALMPRAPDSHVLLGNALFAAGDPKSASAALNDAVNLATKSEPVRRAQVNLLFGEKNSDGAIAAAQAYQKANPGLQADLLLGDTLMRAGHRDQALNVYKGSLAARPSSVTLMRIAQNSISSGDTNSAAESMSSWLKQNPNDNAVRLGYATLLMQRGDNEDAITQFRELLKDDPNNVPSLNNLAWLTRNQDPQNAIAMATKAASLAPNWSDVLDTLGWLKLKHGKAAESLPLLKRAHDLRPQDGEVSYHLALSLEATGSHDAAKGLLKALLASHAKFDDLSEANKLAASWH